MSSRKTIITDEFHYEHVDETTVKYVPPPVLVRAVSPVNTTTTTVVRVRSSSPPRCRLSSSPARCHVSSPYRIFYPYPARASCRYLAPRRERTVDVEIEHCSPAPPPPPRRKSLVCTNFESNNDASSFKYDYKYDVKYECEEAPRRSCLPRSKSVTNISTNFKSSTECLQDVKNSLTYVYDHNSDNDKHQVTYVKHSNDDSGSSLAGCLVKASPSFLPCNRSTQVGAIFNGNCFGLLTEHLLIRDSFNVSFQFRTNTRDGILMMIVDSHSNDSFFIELYNSQLKATLLIDGEPDSCWTDFPSAVLSNDIWSDVDFKIVENRMSMNVRNKLYTKHHRCHLKSPIRGDLYVAGHPSTISPPFACRSRDFFLGEMRNFFVNSNGVKWYGVPSYVTPRLRNWY